MLQHSHCSFSALEKGNLVLLSFVGAMQDSNPMGGYIEDCRMLLIQCITTFTKAPVRLLGDF